MRQETIREHVVGTVTRFIHENEHVESDVRTALEESGFLIISKNGNSYFPPLPPESGLLVVPSGPMVSGEKPEMNIDAVIIYDPKKVEVKSDFIVGAQEQTSLRTKMGAEGWKFIYPYPIDRVVAYRSLQANPS